MEQIIVEDVKPGDVCLMCSQGRYRVFAEDFHYTYIRCPNCQHERLIEKVPR